MPDMNANTNTPTVNVTTTTTQKMTVDEILSYLQTAAKTVEAVGLAFPGGAAIAGGAEIAAALIGVAKSAFAAHVLIAGEPIDLSKLDWDA